MSAEQRIRDFLHANAGRSYCDDCLSSALAIRPRQQVQQKTSKLGAESFFRRTSSTCVRCRSVRISIEAVGSPPQRHEEQVNPNDRPLIADDVLTLAGAEDRYCLAIRSKDRALRNLLDRTQLSESLDAKQWLAYLIALKDVLGNINNDVAFIATLLIKEFLARRFAVTGFDAAAKPQGASGLDIEAKTDRGERIIGELKTTKPYQRGFGAQQRIMITKDLRRLASTSAAHRFMFVTDADTFQTLKGPSFVRLAPGVELVHIVSGLTFVCPSGSS